MHAVADRYLAAEHFCLGHVVGSRRSNKHFMISIAKKWLHDGQTRSMDVSRFLNSGGKYTTPFFKSEIEKGQLVK